MLHARKDYNFRIQDSDHKIGKDEPVFLLRAQDLNALLALYEYYRILQENDNSCPAIVEGVKRQIGRFINWRKSHTDSVKPADMKMKDVL